MAGGAIRLGGDSGESRRLESGRLESDLAWAKTTRRRRRRAWMARRGMKAMLVCGVLLALGCAFMWQHEARLNRLWQEEESAQVFRAQVFRAQDLPGVTNGSDIGSYELPLRTRGRDIVDGQGRRFRMAAVNWYGASDEHFVVGGLDVEHREAIAATIRRLGFNSVRVPYADELVVRNPAIAAERVRANPDLAGRPALDVLEAAVEALTAAGLAVVINNHITSATWCCGADPCDAGWANGHLGGLCRVRQSEEQWMANWERVMRRFVDNPRVVGADLRNEVRGVWGTMRWGGWAAAAERCGNRLLQLRRDWLIVVEGTQSANDLTGARRRPVRLAVPNRLVYSVHVYSWSGWGSLGGRFATRSFRSFAEAMDRSWAWLLRGDVTPVWVGEIGAPRDPSRGDANYWRNLMRFLRGVDADFAYWALNPRKPHANASESYSLLADDWVTPVLDYRLRDLLGLHRHQQLSIPSM